MTEKRKIYDDAFGMDPEDLEEKQPVNGLVPIYANVFEQIQLLPESDRHIVYDAICKYGLYEEKPDHLPLLAHMIFLGAKPAIDSYYKRANGGKKATTLIFRATHLPRKSSTTLTIELSG